MVLKSRPGPRLALGLFSGIVGISGLAVAAVMLHAPLERPLHALASAARAAVTNSFTLSAVAAPTAVVSLPVPPTVIGMNLGGPSYWSTEWTFNDPVQSTGQLFFVDPVTKRGVPLVNQTKADIAGRPIDVPANTRFEIAVQNHAGHQLSGTFECSVAPGWSVKITSPNMSLIQKGTNFTISVPQNLHDNRFVLQLTAQNDHVALSTLACARKGSQGLFNPDFLADVRPFRIVRFMDWMRTNGAPLRRWAERPTPRSLSQAGEKGVALEHMVALCTELPCDPWFTLPLDTDADYYRQFAVYVRDHLPRSRKIYVELSNEVWNNGFDQGKLAVQRGQAAYPGVSAGQAADFYYADRVRALMKIWTDVFAGQQNRLVRVYASQAANAARAQQGLGHLETWRSVDVLAVAPYIFANLQDFSGSGPARINAMFGKAPGLIDQAIGWARANKAVAARYNLGFVTYEGGQHYFGYTPDAKADLMAMQRDPRMCTVYRSYLDGWATEIGGPLVLFNSVGSGSWAHKEYTGQPAAEAPKMRAVLNMGCTF